MDRDAGNAIFGSLSRLSIRHKIVAISLATSCLVALLFVLTTVTTEYRAGRAALTEAMSSAARMAGLNAAAALTFNDREAAGEVLGALRAHRDVVAASILDPSGKVFVGFSREQGDNAVRTVLLREPIEGDGRLLGTVEVRASLERVEAGIVWQVAVLAATTVLTLIVAYSVSASLQRLITGPIAELVGVVRRVGTAGDYRARAKKTTEDELGVLVEGLNGMVEQLERRDEELGRLVSELKSARDSAEAASLAKSRFLATMSHEIRTPMNGVLGMANLLGRSELTAKQRQYLETISRSGADLLHVIDEVLDFSKIEADRMTLDVRPFSPRELVEGTLALMAARASDKDVRLANCVEAVLPARVVGDANRLRQVLLNLLSNAVKFTAHGNVSVRARPLRTTDSRVTLRFEVQDSGIGISPAALRTIFDPFTQADDSTTRRFGGTGLGLAICKRLVELMGGSIGAASEPGSGSTFHFEVELPLAEETAEPPALIPADIAALNVLIIDTVADEANAIASQIGAWGPRCTVAIDIAQANAVIERHVTLGRRIDVMIIDTAIDSHSASALFGRLQNQHGGAPTVIGLVPFGDGVTPFARASFVVTAILATPVMMDDLQETLLIASRIGAHAPPEPVRLAAGAGERLHARVLLAEDNEINRLVCIEMLRTLGCEYVAVDNGREALDYLRTAEPLPDAVLMDVQMPEMDGLAATAAIRSLDDYRQRAIPIIALTANAMHSDRETCLRAGMDDYVAKPFELADLERVLRHWVGKASLRSGTPHRLQLDETGTY
jgi:two-component system, sensor histidine kinase and response regulator